MSEGTPDGARLAAAPDDGLGRVTRAAAAAVAAAETARAQAVAAVADAELSAGPEVVAREAAVTTEQAAVDAATRAAHAARSARTARALAATAAAEAVAKAAARTVEAVQARADELAAAVASTAAAAAAAVSNSIRPGTETEGDVREAMRVGAAVIAAATAKAEETARAAVLVARAVAAAAAAVATTTAAEAAAMEHEVLDAAVALRAVTAETAHQLAAETVDRAAAVETATRAAAVAAERLREANRQLQLAGRHDRNVALALQAAMLTKLPEPRDLQLAARYLTAAEQDQVGGDWYDALVLPDATTTLIIGDVVGHDIAAAAVMGQLRNVLRAFVWDHNELPSAVVARLDRAIHDLHIGTQATIIVATVEPAASEGDADHHVLRWTNAGHPAPILVHADGTAVVLSAAIDVLVGVRPETARRDHTHLVPAGATLLLYTDGLIERHDRDIDTGQQLLLDAVARHHRLPPGDLLDAVITDMVGSRPADDVAVLAARFYA